MLRISFSWILLSMIIGPICIRGLLFCCHLPRVIEGVCVVTLVWIIVFILIWWQLLGSWIWASLIESVLRGVFFRVSVIIAIISWASTSTFAFLPQGWIFPAYYLVFCLVFSFISRVILVFIWGTSASAFLA